jgi:hypothetical protein
MNFEFAKRQGIKKFNSKRRSFNCKSTNLDRLSLEVFWGGRIEEEVSIPRELEVEDLQRVAEHQPQMCNVILLKKSVPTQKSYLNDNKKFFLN